MVMVVKMSDPAVTDIFITLAQHQVWCVHDVKSIHTRVGLGKYNYVLPHAPRFYNARLNQAKIIINNIRLK